LRGGVAGRDKQMTATLDQALVDPQQTIAELQQRLDQYRAELDEALAREAATAEVLHVINSSPGDLAPVFDAILEKAHSLCGAAHGALATYDGEHFRAVALHAMPQRFGDLLRQPFHPYPGGAQERLLEGDRLVHIPDITTREANTPIQQASIEAGIRTLLMVPLRKEKTLLGYITAHRREVQPFSNKEIALLENFGAQAVVAMENARLITETREALEQQTATAEVLGVINSSPGDLAPVFDAMLDKALNLCSAAFGVLWTYDNGHIRATAIRGVTPTCGEFLTSGPHQLRPSTAHARLLSGSEVEHIPDLADHDDYRSGEATPRALVELAGCRSLLAVALRKDGVFLGDIVIYRREVRPFSDKQIALLQNFAAQAVIAMENARLLTETREALEQQTATAEVLQVINSSPGDLAPVFDSILKKAHTLCGAAHGNLWTYDGEFFHPVATHGNPRFAEWLREHRSVPPAPGTVLERIVRGEAFVQSADAVSDEAFCTSGYSREVIEVTGARTTLVVSLRKDTALLGVIFAYRQEVRPFSDKQVALLQNFAAQAVIAMENARLLTETREALEQQTATAQILELINRSPGDLTPVFDAILDKAHSLCGAAHGALMTYDGEHARAVATHGVAEPLAGLLRQPFRPLPNGPLGRLVREQCVIHIPDQAAETQWGPADPRRIATAEGVFGRCCSCRCARTTSCSAGSPRTGWRCGHSPTRRSRCSKASRRKR
jgi:GAF domain-containing protein